MNLFRKFSLNIIDILIVTSVLCIATFFYLGFFRPAPNILVGSAVNNLIIFIKIVIPLITVGIIFLYLLVRYKKIKLSSIILLTISTIVFILIIIPIADYLYQQRSKKSFVLYHSFLQRSPILPPLVDTTKFNIFCVGGSTTEYKDNNGRDWPGLLEKKLSNHFRSNNIKVYNFGRAWYTTQHSLINYINNLRRYKPNIIIVMHAINDAWVNADFSRFSIGKFREDYGHYLGPVTYVVKLPTLFSYIADSFNLLWYADDIDEVNTEYFPGLSSFERNLNTMIELSKSDESQIILLTQPNLYKDTISNQELEVLEMLNKEAIGNGKKWSYKTALSALRQYNQKTREISEEQNVQLIDLEKIIPKSLEYFYDDVHYKDKTFDVIAEFLSEKIALVISQNEIK